MDGMWCPYQRTASWLSRVMTHSAVIYPQLGLPMGRAFGFPPKSTTDHLRGGSAYLVDTRKFEAIQAAIKRATSGTLSALRKNGRLRRTDRDRQVARASLPQRPEPVIQIL